MNLEPINPYNVIKELEAENERLRTENERLKEIIDNGLDNGNNGQNAE